MDEIWQVQGSFPSFVGVYKDELKILQIQA